MKQTFNIPDGCKTVSVEQIGNQLITSFEPEKYVPKKGDFIKFGDGFAECLSNPRTSNNGDGIDITFGHWKPKTQNYIVFEEEVVFCETDDLQQLTPEEFQAEFEKLGCVYDFETHTAHKKRWRAEEDGEYYFMIGSFEIKIACEYNCVTDDLRFKNGNYYKTKEQAEQYRDFMLKKSLEFHTNNK